MSKKIYVASSFELKDEVKRLQEQLIDLGYAISADWTTHKKIAELSDGKVRARLKKEYVLEDTEGVENADIFVLLLSERKGTGSHVEFGVALGAQLPEIYVVGEDDGSQLFYTHPRVTRLQTVEDLLKALRV